MRSLYRTLSFRYLSRRWLRTLLIALSIGLGVATLVATQALNGTMSYAAVFAANPTSGFADLIVSNGDLPVPRSLEAELAKVPGVAEAQPRIFEHALAPDLGDRKVLVLGIDIAQAMRPTGAAAESLQVSEETRSKFAALYAFSKVPLIGGPAPVLIGREMFDVLPASLKTLKLQRGKASKVKEYAMAGRGDDTGDAAALAGTVGGK